MNIIFDLDGTLIDSSERLYQLFQYLIPQSTLTKSEYWNYKRNKIGHQQILEERFSSIDFIAFNKRWLDLIETEEYLALDKCYPDTIESLEHLSISSSLYLLTARQSEKNLLRELKRLKIKDYFRRIYVTANKCGKEELLSKIMIEEPGLFDSGDIFVSDMGRDIKLGNKEKFVTIAITHGFMSKEKLIEYSPAYCVDRLVEILRILMCCDR